MSLDPLLASTDSVALAFQQELEPIEGRDMPLFPPTYPAPERGAHRHDTPYTINMLKDGRRVATLDSVQSQANRMEAAFRGELAYTVPQITLTAGTRTLALTELAHRIADAAIRASVLGPKIHAAFEAYDRGDPLPIAKLGPTSLVFGAWDSRDTRVKIPRLIRSEIHAWDIDVFTRSAQFSGAFSREELGFSDSEWKQGADIGFAPTPSVDQHGGVVVHGPIRQAATIHLGALRQLDKATPGLGPYLLGLAVGALWTGGRDYTLRTGCWLLPSAPPVIEVVTRTGVREPLDLDHDLVLRFLEAQVAQAKDRLGIPAGEPKAVDYDPAEGKKMLKTKDKA